MTDLLLAGVIQESQRFDLSVDLIDRDPDQPRKAFDAEDINNLAEDIVVRGLKYHLRVAPKGDGRYKLIGGERRLRAILQAGIPTVSCLVEDGSLAEADLAEEQLFDDLQAVQLNPMERALGCQRIMNLRQCSGDELAKRMRVKRRVVFRWLSLLRLDDVLQQRVLDGSLPALHGYELAKIDDYATQRAIVARIDQEDLTAKAVTALLRRHRREQKGKSRRLPQAGKIRKTIIRLSPTKGVRVIVHSRSVLNEAQVISTLLRCNKEVLASMLAQRGHAPDMKVDLSLSQVVDLLQAIQATSFLQDVATPLLDNLGALVLSQLIPLFKDESAAVREEAIGLFNSVDQSIRTILSLLLPRKA